MSSGSGSTSGWLLRRPAWLWLVILSNIVHGFAYAFFFATVYIFVDENFPKDVRTSAQSLFNLLILGLGPFVGGLPLEGSGGGILEKGRGKEYHRLHVAIPGSPRAWTALDGHPGALLPSPSQGAGTRRGSRSCQLSGTAAVSMP